MLGIVAHPPLHICSLRIRSLRIRSLRICLPPILPQRPVLRKKAPSTVSLFAHPLAPSPLQDPKGFPKPLGSVPVDRPRSLEA